MERRLCVAFLVVLIHGIATDDYYQDGIFYRTRSGLTEVPTDIPDEAIEVYLYLNEITELKAGAFSNLNECTELNLVRNHISSIETGAFNGLAKLENLQLYYNWLEEIEPEMWIGLGSLTLLRLSSNRFSTLPTGAFRNLPKLEYLSFPNSPNMSVIRGDMFEGIPTLKKLFIYNNGMTSLPTGAFWNLPNLEHLGIRQNELTTLPEDAFVTESGDHPANLKIYMIDNPLQYDQRMCWMKQAMEDGWLGFHRDTPPKCANDDWTPWDEVDLGCSDE